uniref:Uncharacterized protein n=1 Tax=Rhizophagus irregularis (strain DAOM 181602 / DAOM 197198 / MUCL 43194) TaxID=747089 RepID=U9TA49_RHIID
MILLDDCENPYWDDAIDKYLKRPQDIIDLNGYVVERQKDFIITLQLNLEKNAELLNNYTKYKEHFQSKFTQEYQELVIDIRQNSTPLQNHKNIIKELLRLKELKELLIPSQKLGFI